MITPGKIYNFVTECLVNIKLICSLIQMMAEIAQYMKKNTSLAQFAPWFSSKQKEAADHFGTFVCTINPHLDIPSSRSHDLELHLTILQGQVVSFQVVVLAFPWLGP